MTSYVFEKLEAEYAALDSRAKVLPSRESSVAAVCRRLLKDREVYHEIEELSGVPTAALMALSEREMSGDIRCYLGNGQRLTQRTTIVPKGRGPFLTNGKPDFIKGAMDALTLDGLTKVKNWSLSRFSYESEDWNGWGYRSRGIPSPYVFGATSIQRPGKFVADHVYDPRVMDPQIGTLAIVLELFKQDPSLDFTGGIKRMEPDRAPSIIPIAPHPVIGNTNIVFVQNALNKLRVLGTPLSVDGNCGRNTRRAVANYQASHRLVIDGLPGKMTYGSLVRSLAEAGL